MYGIISCIQRMLAVKRRNQEAINCSNVGVHMNVVRRSTMNTNGGTEN